MPFVCVRFKTYGSIKIALSIAFRITTSWDYKQGIYLSISVHDAQRNVVVGRKAVAEGERNAERCENVCSLQKVPLLKRLFSCSLKHERRDRSVPCINQSSREILFQFLKHT